jgi:hypothetical protein
MLCSSQNKSCCEELQLRDAALWKTILHNIAHTTAVRLISSQRLSAGDACIAAKSPFNSEESKPH